MTADVFNVQYEGYTKDDVSISVGYPQVDPGNYVAQVLDIGGKDKDNYKLPEEPLTMD